MSNRTLIYMTGLVLLGMGILFALNLGQILIGSPPNQTYLKYNEVRGIAVKHRQLLYTLNFAQQNSTIDILNQSLLLAEVKPGTTQPVDIEQIIIYQFEGKPDIILTPIAYVDQQLVYQSPLWSPQGYFMEVSVGEFKKLISQSYDRNL